MHLKIEYKITHIFHNHLKNFRIFVDSQRSKTHTVLTLQVTASYYQIYFESPLKIEQLSAFVICGEAVMQQQ